MAWRNGHITDDEYADRIEALCDLTGNPALCALVEAIRSLPEVRSPA